MKKTILLFIFVLIFGCSNNNCSEEKQSINEYYAKQIQYVRDHPGTTGVDYRQIDLLEKERDKKLSEACD